MSARARAQIRSDSALRPRSVAFVIICVVEAVRLHFRWTCFGLRSYEATNLSAQFWGTVGCIIVFLVAPSRGPSKEEQGYLGIPIVWSLGIVDPLMGELKVRNAPTLPRSRSLFAFSTRARAQYHKVELRRRVAIGVVCAAIVWAVAAAWLARDSVFAWIMVVVMAPITVAAEAPKVPSLDDNGLMLLIPLAVAVALHPWAD